MSLLKRKSKFYLLSFIKHDLSASINVFFVALPLCLGVSLASGAPVHTGLLAGIIGGIVIPFVSKSPLSVSGPAAGLTAICAAAIVELGSLELFFLSVAMAGVLQMFLGLLQLGGFTHLIPSAVIKGMLAAIGVILISKQIPLLIGYDEPDFWQNELFNVFTFRHGFENIRGLYERISIGAVAISIFCFALNIIWKTKLAKHMPFFPPSFIIVLVGSLLALFFDAFIPSLSLPSSLFVVIPRDIFSEVSFPDISNLFSHNAVWKNAIVICFVASLETLLSIEAIDKIDPYNRITPQNRELAAQGLGNFISGVVGGIPITSVIVRSAANAEAGAKTKLSAIFHGIWLLLTVALAVKWVSYIPFCVLAVILVQTGYNLAKPAMIRGVYRQGKEQFFPFIVTVVAILFTDLLIGVLIGIAYAIYFLIKHTYRAGYTLQEIHDGHNRHFIINLALNVSFLNKKKFRELLDGIPQYSVVEINGTHSVYIDYDILEIFHDFKSKAKTRHIQLILKEIPDVETIELH